MRNRADQPDDLGKTLKCLLFSDPAPDNAPLFSNATELARFIGELPDQKLTIKSAKSSLSALLSGDRPPSDSLHIAMRHAVRNRLSACDVALQDKWIGRLEATLDEFRNDRHLQRHLKLKDLGVGTGLEEVSKTAKVKFIISPGYVPLNRSGDADASHISIRKGIVRLVAEGLGLFTPRLNPPAENIICFRSEDLAILFLRDLLWTLVDPRLQDEGMTGYSIEEAAAKLIEIETNGLLQLYSMDPYYCLSPTVLYDPHLEYSAAYHIYYESGKVKNFPIPYSYIRAWKQFYHDFRSGTLASVVQVKFADHSDYLSKEAKYSLLDINALL